MTDPLVITIDGPAGTGKSTVAAQLAQRLGIAQLDTGAMYRTVALLALREELHPTDAEALIASIDAHELWCDLSTNPPRMLLDGEDVEPHIRSAHIGAVVSEVATVPQVRHAMVQMQRAVARAHPRLVSEGRDQGSVVFPDAQVRFFLTADEHERVRRRMAQLEAKGQAPAAQDIAAEIHHRDATDSQRATSPLVCPEGAIVIDTTGLNIDDVVDAMLAHVQRAQGQLP